MNSWGFPLTNLNNNPPAENELEISLFGHGSGECVVAHVGMNEWFVVDSCVSKQTGRSVAIDYLENLGVDVSTAVKRVVATHWHDDHTAGISQVASQALEAQIIVSNVIEEEVFQTFVAGQLLGGKNRSSIEEFHALAQVVKSRRVKHQRHSTAIFAHENSRYYFENEPWLRELWTLSPSSASKAAALKKLSSIAPCSGQSRNAKPPKRLGNDMSVVLLLKAADKVVLLGSDLEAKTDPSIGWKAIVNSSGRPTDKAQIFKIPHHGSLNGYESSVWDSMLKGTPVATLAPYRKCKTPLPTDDGLKHYKALTNELWCSAPTKARSIPRRENIVEKEMKSIARKRRTVGSDMGQVMIRMSISEAGAAPSVSTFGAAFKA